MWLDWDAENRCWLLVMSNGKVDYLADETVSWTEAERMVSHVWDQEQLCYGD